MSPTLPTWAIRTALAHLENSGISTSDRKLLAAREALQKAIRRKPPSPIPGAVFSGVAVIEESEDESYQAFIRDCARLCRCCIECPTQVPCAGTLAGGFCDEMCFCLPDPEGDDLTDTAEDL